MLSKIFSNRNLKIVLLLSADNICFVFCAYLALALRFDVIPSEYLNLVNQYILLDLLLLIFIFFVAGIYRNILKYASIFELLNVVLSVAVFEIVDAFLKYSLGVFLPRSYFIIQFMLLVFSLGGLRFAARVYSTLLNGRLNKSKTKRTMIIGGGNAGRLIINEIINSKRNYDNKIVCIIDDDDEKIGKTISNIPIVGNRLTIEYNVKKYNIEEIIIAIHNSHKDEINRIVTECQKTKASILILPKISVLNKNAVNQIRPLSYEDFLGRDEIVVDINQIQSTIKDKVILVTGGGGSIGSELCRQIAKCNPKQLIIFDIYENNAYDIQQELLRNHPDLDLLVFIGSVRDYDRLEVIFKNYSPNIVFHAAAHKHVPLMEVSPNEAIKNNCLGTFNAAKLADLYKADRFVLISTDKAVRPTNVMGATKRICEMIVQAFSRRSNCEYVAVRFGNVLGSNGSVIPLFLKQIESGGPVTVTHKDITRFFMTIPEAVSLILQAGTFAKGGEIFVLDMGEPVKIYDLALKIIRFKGLEPGRDIDIKITGLRPGEKLYEEILMEEEGLKETPNNLIHIGAPILFDDDKFFISLDNLIKDAYLNSDDIKDKVASIVTTYKVDKRDSLNSSNIAFIDDSNLVESFKSKDFKSSKQFKKSASKKSGRKDK